MRYLTDDEKNHLLFKTLLNFGYTDNQFNRHRIFNQLCGSTADFLMIHFEAFRVRDEHKNMLKSRRKLEKEFKGAYEAILNRWVELLIELNITEPIEIADFFSLLLWNGYFSVNKNLYYQSDDRANLQGWFSLDIMCGNGVCLNFSDMLKDLLNKMSIDAALLINYADKLKRNNITRELIVQKMKEDKPERKIFLKLMNPLLKKYGNHAFVVIRDQNKLFAYDPTNLLCANIKDIKQAVVIDGKGSFDLKLASSYAYARTNPEYSALDGVFELSSDIPSYTRSELKDAWISAYYMFKANQYLIDECYEDTLPAVKYIAKKIEKRKK